MASEISLLTLEQEYDKRKDTSKKLIIEYWDDGISIHYFLTGNVVSASGFTRNKPCNDIERAIQTLIDKAGDKA